MQSGDNFSELIPGILNSSSWIPKSLIQFQITQILLKLNMIVYRESINTFNYLLHRSDFYARNVRNLLI